MANSAPNDTNVNECTRLGLALSDTFKFTKRSTLPIHTPAQQSNYQHQQRHSLHPTRCYQFWFALVKHFNTYGNANVIRTQGTSTTASSQNSLKLSALGLHRSITDWPGQPARNLSQYD
uniref:Uncharacterized protein n=1 Tax=Schistocephalus solidus TaxID=70667 RepID=A0A0V0JBY2_SCHSO